MCMQKKYTTPTVQKKLFNKKFYNSEPCLVDASSFITKLKVFSLKQYKDMIS